MFLRWTAIFALACCLSGGLVDAHAADERRVALVISNANYENTPTLTNPPLDAEAVAEILRDMRFDEVDVLLDATADALRKRLRDFALKARLADVAVIYYAGHGLEADGQNYLVPVDARLETDLDVSFETVGIDLAVRAVNGAKKLKLIILDACRDNPLVAGRPADGKSRSFGTGLAPIETAGDVLVSYAAAAGKVALDGPAGDNSPFAKALVNHLRAPGVDVRQVLGRVRDDVKRATGDKQQPFIYASLGGDPIYLIPPPELPPRGPSPVVVDLTMADPEEDAVKAMLGEDNDQFRFAYDLAADTGTTKSTRVRPRLDYFVSAEQRGRPLIEALDYGYFAPQEFTMWSVSYPLLDIIARRNEPKVVTLSDLVVEVEQSASDPTPYVGLVSPSDQFGRLVLFNEGWSDVRRATLEYDVLGFEEPPRQAVEALLQAKRAGGYAHRASVGAFQDFAFISLTEGLARAVPGFAFYSHAFRNPPTEFTPDGRPRLRAASGPRGYAEWARANPHVFNSEARGRGVWVVGRMIVEAAATGIPPLIADFVAAVPIYPPEGLGGGAISYNLKDRINIRTDGVRYTVRKSIGYLLDNDTKTFRGLFPLTADRTSKHRLRFLLNGDGGQNLWTSDWIDMHIVVPRLSKKSAEWKGKGRAPFRGLQ